MLLRVRVQCNLNCWRGGKLRWTLSCNWILYLLLSSSSPSTSYNSTSSIPKAGLLSASSMFGEGGEYEHPPWQQPFNCDLCAKVRSKHDHVDWHLAKILLKAWSPTRPQGAQGSVSQGVEGSFLLLLSVEYALLVESSLERMFETHTSLIL